MRNFGVNQSDLDETWWKLIPGVSRSFLNSSGTKITAKNTIVKLKFKDSRHAQLSIYAVFHEESEFAAKNDQIRQLEPKNKKNEPRQFGFFGHSSYTRGRIWTKLGGFFSYQSPGPF